MKPLQRLGIFILSTIFFAGLVQSPLMAADVRVLVSPGQKKQLAELERSLPNLELVAAKPDQILDVIADCDAIIGLGYGGARSRQIIQAGKKLRWVHSTSAGVEKIVWIPELKDSDIILTNAKIFQGPEIADHAFGLLLTLTRNLKHYNRRMDEGWERVTPDLPIIELRGKTMLIVGLGGIGTQVAQRAFAFDMRVLAVDPKDIPLMHIVERVVRPDQLHEVLPQADVVVSSVPHTAASEGMFGEQEFGLMRDGVYFVNVSRGKGGADRGAGGSIEIGQGPGCGPGRHQPRAATQGPSTMEDEQRYHYTPYCDGLGAIPHPASRTDSQQHRAFRHRAPHAERRRQGGWLLT